MAMWIALACLVPFVIAWALLMTDLIFKALNAVLKAVLE